MDFDLTVLRDLPSTWQFKVSKTVGWLFVGIFSALAVAFALLHIANGRVSLDGFLISDAMSATFVALGVLILGTASPQATVFSVDGRGFVFRNSSGTSWGGSWSDSRLKFVLRTFRTSEGAQLFWVAMGWQDRHRSFVTEQGFAALYDHAQSIGLRVNGETLDVGTADQRITIQARAA